MIIALPYANGEVDGHFGRTEAFLIAEVGDGRVLSKAVRPVEGLHHDHGGGDIEQSEGTCGHHHGDESAEH